MQGSLTEISLVDLIQINCLERKRARLRLWFEHCEAVLFFDEGEIVHARTGAGKVLAMLPEGDPSPQELGPTVREIERFTRLFIGRDQADDLADRLQSILSGS